MSIELSGKGCVTWQQMQLVQYGCHWLGFDIIRAEPRYLLNDAVSSSDCSVDLWDD
jgi:hypothetical protein